MRAQVWNDNDYPHSEMFKEQRITIAPHSFIEMDAVEDAHEFKCQMTPLRTDGEKNPLPQYFKKIRVVPIPGGAQAPQPLICHATGKMAANQAELDKMNAEYIGLLEEASKEQIAEAEALKEEVAILKARLATLEALGPDVAGVDPDEFKRGPGRPKKQ